MAVILSLGALVVALAGVILAHRRNQDLHRRIEVAIQEVDRRLDDAVSDSTARIDAWVRARIDDANADQRQTTADTLSQWSAELVAEIDALLESFRATVKADTAAFVGRTLSEFGDPQLQGDGSRPR